MTFNSVRTICVLLALAAVLTGCAKSTEELLASAKEREARGDSTGAIIDLKAAIQQKSDDSSLRFMLGRLYNATFDAASAEKELRKAKELGLIEGGRVDLELARALKNQQKFVVLVNEIKPAAAYETKVRASILAIRGRALQTLGRSADAKRSLLEAESIDATNEDVVLLSAQIRVVEGDAEGALSVVNELLKHKPNNLEALVYKAGVLRLVRRPEDAIEAFGDVLKRHPTHFGALRGRAVLLTWLGRLDEAQKSIDVLKEVYKGHPQVLVDQGVVHFARRQFGEARASAEAALKASPGFSPAELLLGLAHQALGSEMQAERLLAKYLQANAGSGIARYALAAQLLAMKQASRALEVIEPSLRGEVRSAPLMNLAADIYSSLGNHQEALRWYERAAALDPQRAEARIGEAFTHLRVGKVDAALESLEEAVSLTKSATPADEFLVVASLSRGETRRAVGAMENLEKRAPDSPLTHNLKGLVLLKQGKKHEATRSFEKALALNPAFLPAAGNLAHLDLAAGDLSSARRRYEIVLNADKHNADALLALAAIERRAGREFEAVELLERTARMHPNLVQPREQLASIFLRNGEKQRAIEVAEQALAASPENPRAILLSARTQLTAGNVNRAVQVAAKIVQIFPEAPSAHVALARIQLMAGLSTDAEAGFRRALSLDGRYEPAQQGLVALLVAQGRSEDALSIARNVQRHEPNATIGFVMEGEIEEERHRFSDAVNAYRAAAKISRGGDNVVRIFRVLTRAGDRRAGFAELHRYLEKHPDDRQARAAIAYAYFEDQDYRTAALHYQLLVKSHPDFAEGLNGLAWVYHVLNDDRALKVAEAALALAPQLPQIQDTLGVILLQKGDLKRARDLLTQAAAVSDDPGIRYHLAIALSRIGDRSTAQRYLENVLAEEKIFPERKEAESLLRQLKNG